MIRLESNTTWRIFKKVCSCILVFTFSSYVLPVSSYAADSTNYRLATFATNSAGEAQVGTAYDSNPNTFGEAVNGDLESANTKTKSGFLHTVIKDETAPPVPLPGTDRLAESANFRQMAYILSIADTKATSTNFNIALACTGEPVGGISENLYDMSFVGHLYTILGNAPILKQNIPNQSWQINTSKSNAFDLDDYFIDPDGGNLTFTVNGNTNITVAINSTTHQVSFSQGAGFVGNEELIFTAIDTEGNRTSSQPVTLNVFNVVAGGNNAPVLEYIAGITAKEGQLIKISPQAQDPDGNTITYSFSAPFNNQGSWQTDYQSAGTYDITVTASDGRAFDSQQVRVTVLNVNRQPTLNYIADITGPENQLITITPTASDPDGDSLTFSFSPPFNTQGQWRPTYQDAGVRIVSVTVSDGSLTDAQDVLVNVTNVNTAPKVSISLDRINAAVNEEISFIVTAKDADNDPLTLILQKDGNQVYSGKIYQFYVGSTSFSSLGVHTIKAIVQDNHSAQAETTANVEIINPQELWNKILPLLGDFNGDGIVDIGTYNRNTGRWAVALSNQQGFGSVTEWLANFGASTDWCYVNGDFNGDGKTDVAIFNQSNGQWRVGLSDGTRFTDQGVWTTSSGVSSNSLPITGDFNADGISDVGTYNKSNGQVKCALSTKSGFNAETVWASGLAYSSTAQAFTGDFNGDGLIDIGVFNDGNWSFAVSTGTEFMAQGAWNLSFGTGKTAVISDFNHDGLTDIGVFDKTEGLWTTALSTGSRFSSEGCWLKWLKGFGQGEYNTPYALDFNGDSLTDAAIFDNANFTWQRLAAQGKVADLLQKITTSLGGATELTYTSSVNYDNTGDDDLCDLPFALQTVSRVKQGDGLGNFYYTDYSYANGLYDAEDREARGFGYVRVADGEGNIAETWFKQDDIFKGSPYKTQIRDAHGELYLASEKTYAYTTPYTGCTFAYLREEETSTYDGQITPRTTRTTYEYDGYGNPTKIIGLGEVDVNGDEQESNIEYVYNTGLWILGLPCHSYLKDAQGKIVSQKWLYYDNHTSFTEQPVKGELTKEESWLDTPGKTNPITQKSYDAYGNVLTTTDARNKVTTIIYDTVFHIYPETITNHLGQTIRNTYDPKTGQVLTSTDPNNQTTRNEYDVFGRLLKVFGPNDDATHPSAFYEYDLSTHPAKITTYVREEYNTADPNKIRTAYTFIDGLGRTIQTKTEADDLTKQVVSGVVTFDSRGKPNHQYLPDVTAKTSGYTNPNLTQPKTTYEYDCLGRTVKLTNPDLTEQTVEYSPGVITATDENGHSFRNLQDAYGQTVKIEEFNHGRIYTTTYEYDAQGNLLKTIDDQGNTTEITYDSLGRKLLIDDPDMGNWSYDYDANGNLIKQTDAKGQILEFVYDALNRLTTKSLRASAVSEAISITYSYDATTKPNCIGRLSKVNDQSGSSEFFYDNLGRETKSIKTISPSLRAAEGGEAISYTVERTYDAQDRLKTLTYPDGEIITYTYTVSGGIKTVVGNQTYVFGVTYTASGQMSLLAYGNGTHTDYTYNPQTLRLEHLTTNDGALQNLQYQFDNVGNIKTITDSSHSATQSFAYDDLNRLTSAIGQTYGTKTYRYDSIGNIIEKDGLTYAYGENGAGPHAVTSLRGDASSPSLRGASAASDEAISYDPNGNMLSKNNSTFAYDLENRLVSVTSSLRGSAATEAISFNLTLSPGWNFISIPYETIEINGTLTPLNETLIQPLLSPIEGKYDQVSRYNPAKGDFDNYNNTSYNQFDTLEYGRGYLVYVKQACTLSLRGSVATEAISKQLKSGWNLIGAPSTEEISVSAALNNLQQGIDYDKIVRYNKTSQLFENLTSTNLLNHGEAYYLHCLKDVTWEIPVTARQTTQFLYDGDGGRVKKTITNPSLRGTAGAEAISTTYIGSLYEVESDGTARKHIFSGSKRICTISSLRGSAATEAISYYHSDHLGSSNIITNQTGQLVQHLEYLPFGQTQLSTGTDIAHHKFTGKELDDSTGLYFYGARYYDPELGRFISPDTIVQAPYNPQTLNRYSYCNNNPINYVDPSGHWSWKKFWHGFAGAFIGVALTIVLGPAGLGMSLGMAGMIGGAAGGALTGGLEGGWKGALIGAGIGGALGGLGGWGISQYGAGFGVGMLAAGAGYAGATNSWDSFAGGLAGGYLGYQVGSGINSYFNDPLSIKIATEGRMKDLGPSENKNWRMLGIRTTDSSAQAAANANDSVVFYTKSRGSIADLVRSGMQKVFGNSLASRQFVGNLKGAAGGNIYAHSEGTLTLAGAMKALQTDGTTVAGLNIDFNAPGISRTTAANLAQSIGAIHSYSLNWGDPMGVITTLNPARQIIYGVGGVATLATFHKTEHYP